MSGWQAPDYSYMAHLEAIHSAPAHGAPMHSQQQVMVVEGLGLEGDRYARSNRAGQIMLMPGEQLDSLDLWPGAVRENLTTRGLDAVALRPGTRLKVGTAVLEVTGPAPPCSHNGKKDSGFRRLLGGQRGLLCHAVQGGEIAVGDPIEIL